MTYNSRVLREQGASVFRVASGGSLTIDSGGKVTNSGAFYLGNVQFLFGNLTNPPTVSASPGSWYFRSDGSASNAYLNVSDGTTGSVWTAACINAP